VETKRTTMNSKKTWLVALAICLLLATISPLASSAPDGLEKVAEDNGFSEAGHNSPLSIVADYVFPGVRNEILATILAGWLGTALVFLLAYGSARVIYQLKGGHARP